MIKEKEIYVICNPANRKHLESKNYIFQNNKKVLVKVEDLSIGSHTKITAVCDICGDEKTKEYKSYLESTNNKNYYTCMKCRYKKVKETCLEKFGFENCFQNEEIKEKIKEFWMSNYNVSHPRKLESVLYKWRRTLESKGYKNLAENNDFLKYSKKIHNLTKLKKEKLFSNWNGYDHYDNEYIKENINLNSNSNMYPTIDHKISIYNGFLLEKSIEFMSSDENLCITKRGINSSKNTKNEEEFKVLIFSSF